VGAQLAALRSARSRSIGDLRDLESLCRWVGERGGDLVTVLPLLPTFNAEPPEPSPYSPVSRLFWSELILDLGDAHVPVPSPRR
jgi:4-alpha-glucanotransferase